MPVAVVVTIVSVIAIVGSLAGVAALVWIAATGHDERAAEDAAREHFARHGTWPDEPPAPGAR